MRLLFSAFCSVLLASPAVLSQHRQHRHGSRHDRRGHRHNRPASSTSAPQPTVGDSTGENPSVSTQTAVIDTSSSTGAEAVPTVSPLTLGIAPEPAAPPVSEVAPLPDIVVPETPVPAEWIARQPRLPWHHSREAIWGSGFNAPGLFVLPELETSLILGSDPLGYRHLGLAPVAAFPLTMRFRFGWTIGRLTISGAARFSFIAASPQQLPYDGAAWNSGAEIGLRYTFLSGSAFQPFISASGGLLFWQLPITVSSGANAERVSGAATVVARGGVGISIRLVRWLYLDVAASVEWMSGNSLQTGGAVLSGDQIAIVPSLGLSHYISAR